MLSRLRYTLRETFDSFRRNATLTVASIITAAISLLGVGLTLLSQHAFDNLLARWEGGVEMIVFMNPTATEDQLTLVGDALTIERSVHRELRVLRRDLLARGSRPDLRRRTRRTRPAHRGHHPHPVQGGPDRRDRCRPPPAGLRPVRRTPGRVRRQLRRGPDQPDQPTPELLRIPPAPAVGFPAARRHLADLEHDQNRDFRANDEKSK